MTKEDRIKLIRHLKYNRSIGADYMITDKDADEIIKALEQEPRKMRTFVFTKSQKTESGKIVMMIVGMIHSDMYPSTELAKGGEYYGCTCHEVPEGPCYIEIGTLKPCQ